MKMTGLYGDANNTVRISLQQCSEAWKALETPFFYSISSRTYNSTYDKEKNTPTAQRRQEKTKTLDKLVLVSYR